MQQQMIKRTPIADFVFKEDSDKQIRIPRDFLYTRLIISLSLNQHNVGVPARPLCGGMFNIIKNFTLSVNNRIKPWRDLSGRGLFVQNLIDQRRAPRGFAIPSLVAGTNTKHNLIFEIDLRPNQAVETGLFGLDLRASQDAPDLIRDAFIELSFGNYNDLFGTGNGGEITNVNGVKIWAEHYTQPNAIAPNARLPLRFIREKKKEYTVDDVEIEYILPKNNAIDYGAITALIDSDFGCMPYDEETPVTLKMGEEPIYEDVTIGMLLDRADRHLDFDVEEGILHIPFWSDRTISQSLQAAYMREDVSFKFRPTFDLNGAAGKHHITVLEEQFRNWDFAS